MMAVGCVFGRPFWHRVTPNNCHNRCSAQKNIARDRAIVALPFSGKKFAVLFRK